MPTAEQATKDTASTHIPREKAPKIKDKSDVKNSKRINGERKSDRKVIIGFFLFFTNSEYLPPDSFFSFKSLFLASATVIPLVAELLKAFSSSSIVELCHCCIFFLLSAIYRTGQFSDTNYFNSVFVKCYTCLRIAALIVCYQKLGKRILNVFLDISVHISRSVFFGE